ncbi:MAG: Fe-S cluster assembly ATPase SufC [Acidimicrobiia bacterium]|nr:Fe-S cluster assembly ATPase SufC [Acidimicrobiia bacterium]MBT8192268.1 Fe-S cluster assembly ATPase SufC [Acidimicrobiia bacterium]MBT8246497.1 Fe-S cluster assembly ATPase SufC [Acidimicrobiia bacterium]NNF88821.1 Fe-S cluster assembly ATPase SufC [Acidimicrobiia bacterium]NNJ47837.1 Fe-S cluster assembly ATPase SufC [Acidimicrobiia bacterium]
MSTALAVKDLHASIGSVQILKGLDLEVGYGELHVIMGPNGSGKSTLCHVLMGKPDYDATGSALVGGNQLLGESVETRSRLGLAEAFQYPTEIPGITLRDLFEELAEQRDDGDAIRARVHEVAALLGTERFLDRPVNEGLSGGEKKRSEIFQLAVLAPAVAVLDEIDSGLDVDAVREVAEAVERMRGPDIGILLITHYNRILKYLTPDRVHVMVAGKIVQSGGPELAAELEETGYTDLVAGIMGDQPADEDDFLAGL